MLLEPEPETEQNTKKSSLNKKELTNNYSPTHTFEIGIDEAGRGPMFGRLYVSAVVFDKITDLSKSNIKDSKKFTSKKKIKEVADWIKANALAWHIQYIEADVIDKINIREAVLSGMRTCAEQVLLQLSNPEKPRDKLFELEQAVLLIDGTDFRPYMVCMNEEEMRMKTVPHICIPKGDATCFSIAGASILAKVARDEYVLELCKEHPLLVERYSMDTNMGYGTAEHMRGIAEHGISQWHRKTYGVCQTTEQHDV